MPGATHATNWAPPNPLTTDRFPIIVSSDIRSYLVERFRSDAATLRQRAAAIASAPKPIAGPDAMLSRRMADACDEVASLSELLPTTCTLNEMLIALHGLVPELQRRANDSQLNALPAVRSVYVGAATRVQELIAAESNARGNVTDDNFEDDDGDME